MIFFGIPHEGTSDRSADPRGIPQYVAESLVKAVRFKFNEQILDSLLPSSERLAQLRDEFNPLALDQEWVIHSFQEELGMRALGGRRVGRHHRKWVITR